MPPRLTIALAVLALAACGGDDQAAPPAAPEPDPARLDCEDVTMLNVDYAADAPGEGDDLVALARRHLEDELAPTDRVERIEGDRVRVVRGGRTIAVLRYFEAASGGGYLLGIVEGCSSFVDRAP